MKTTEIRVNNYYHIKSLDKKEYEPFVRLCPFYIANAVNNEIDIKPIQLNYKSLLKLGFKREGFVFYLYDFAIIKEDEFDYRFEYAIYGLIKFSHSVFDVKLMYVHELQNLLFILTGKELTIGTNE